MRLRAFASWKSPIAHRRTAGTESRTGLQVRAHSKDTCPACILALCVSRRDASVFSRTERGLSERGALAPRATATLLCAEGSLEHSLEQL